MHMPTGSKRKWLIAALALVVFGLVYFKYLGVAFSGSRCEGARVRHGEITEQMNDCYGCHQKVTPQVAQDWYESKHGMTLVKCYLCHGQPDGKGAVPFTARPSVEVVCQRCHAPAIEMMQKKFGVRDGCDTCHGFHMNSLHHAAYDKTESKEKFEQD